MTIPRKVTPNSRRRFIALSGVSALGGIAASTVVAPAASAADGVVSPLTVHGVHNILEFGDPSMTDETRFRMAVDFFVAARQEVTLTVSRSFVIADTLVVDTSYISLDFTTGNIDATGLQGKPAFQFKSSSTSGHAYNRASVRGLRVIGPGASSTGSVGLLFDTTGGSIRGVGFYGLEVAGFQTGLSFENNAYLLSFYSFHISRCGTGISMPGGKSNYGENIRFIGGGVGTCDLAIYNANPNGNFHLTAVSIDLCLQAAFAEYGGIFLSQPHIEIHETGAASPNPQFVTGANQSAKIIINSGLLLYTSTPVAPYIFETRHTGWGGGIFVSQLTMYNPATSSGYLCGGTEKAHFTDLVQYDGNSTGASNGAIMPYRSANLLVNGNFALPTVVDQFVNATDATSRTSSPLMTLTVSNQKLVVTRIGTKSVMLAVDVPVTHGLTYASLFAIENSTSTGTLAIIESWIAISSYDSKNMPIVSRSEARGPSNIAMSTVRASLPFVRRNGPMPWNRVAPAWATHYRLRLNFTTVSAGQTTFSEFVVTAL
ncbi:hypothetical protein MT349_03950 [Rathayibacter caricis]|uniref:hypothetical protein n=1 Tax=Rathayibacter caricis TaxID=110936 RepID=UPI001FB44970|nr:hypothetical protein [Rathayibacter caricis]MCJ1694924.1 hypothetical protein [Rathayibacter caricis]